MIEQCQMAIPGQLLTANPYWTALSIRWALFTRQTPDLISEAPDSCHLTSHFYLRCSIPVAWASDCLIQVIQDSLLTPEYNKGLKVGWQEM